MENKPLEDLTTRCIRCGFCLEACPTFLESGSELDSPRGRIYLVRSVMEGKLTWSEDVKGALDRCLGCRACEPACPSGVEYGQILELARNQIRPSLPRKLLLGLMTRPVLFRLMLGSAAALHLKRMPFSKTLFGKNATADLPTPQRLAPMPEIKEMPLKGEVYFLEGCVMPVLYSRVNEAAKRLLLRVGYRVREVKQGCCGALHAHSGMLNQANGLAQTLMDNFKEPLPITVDSAGCGSHLKALDKQGRVKDLSEFLEAEGLADLLSKSPGINKTATYHDACHLAHGQGVTKPPRNLLNAIPNLTLVPLPESDHCCGSAGTYNLTQPEIARKLLDRKWANVEKTGAQIVASGNPGCHAWIAQAAREAGGSVSVLHTAELLEASFIGIEWFA